MADILHDENHPAVEIDAGDSSNQTKTSPFSQTARLRSGWVLFILIVALQFALFTQRAKTDVIWAYPTSFDQTVYLYQAYNLFDQITHVGLPAGLEHGLAVPSPNGKLFPVEAAILFLFTGPGRLGALTLNFFYLALLECLLFYSALWLTGRWSTAFVALGLLMVTASRFLSAGGLMDFRIDFAASCLFGIFICIVIRSGVFADARWSFAAGVAAGFLIDTRFLTAIYVAVLWFVQLIFFFILSQWAHLSAGTIKAAARKRVRNLLIAASAILIITIPAVWATWSALVQYYVVASIGESSFRNAELGLRGFTDSLLFYPRDVATIHLGSSYLTLSILLLIIALSEKLWSRDSPIAQPVMRHAMAFFVPSTLLLPLVILIAFPSKSPLVGNILIIPCIATTLLVAFVVAGRLQRFVRRQWIPVFQALLAIVAMGFGIGQELSGSVQRVLPPGSVADYNSVSALYDEIGARSEEYGWSEPRIAFDRIYDFLHPMVLSPLYYERHGVLLSPVVAIGSRILPVTDKEALDGIANADIVVLTDPQSPAEPNYQYPYSVSMHDKYQKLRALADAEMVGVRRFHVFSQELTLYVRPVLKIQGDSGGWITSDGVTLTEPSDLIRLRPVLELSGTTMLFENLGSTLHARARIFDGDRAVEEAVATITPAQQYNIVFRLHPDLIRGPETRLQVTFDKYFVPKEVGFNSDTRKLVLMKPQRIQLLPSTYLSNQISQ